VLSYDGTDYHGWQVQAGARTVQGTLVETARRRFGADTRVTGASRTDAGVHALRQVASLTTTARIAAAGLRGALNADLPRDIRVLDAREAPVGFDARWAATGKRYAYLIDGGPIASPLLARYAWHIPQALDVGAMRRALVALRGRHDFGAWSGRSMCSVARSGSSSWCRPIGTSITWRATSSAARSTSGGEPATPTGSKASSAHAIAGAPGLPPRRKDSLWFACSTRARASSSGGGTGQSASGIW